MPVFDDAVRFYIIFPRLSEKTNRFFGKVIKISYKSVKLFFVRRIAACARMKNLNLPLYDARIGFTHAFSRKHYFPGVKPYHNNPQNADNSNGYEKFYEGKTAFSAPGQSFVHFMMYGVRKIINSDCLFSLERFLNKEPITGRSASKGTFESLSIS